MLYVPFGRVERIKQEAFLGAERIKKNASCYKKVILIAMMDVDNLGEALKRPPWSIRDSYSAGS